MLSKKIIFGALAVAGLALLVGSIRTSPDINSLLEDKEDFWPFNATPSTGLYELWKENYQCDNVDMWPAFHTSAKNCEHACTQKAKHRVSNYFLFGKGWKFGRCWCQFALPDASIDGQCKLSTTDNYDVYRRVAASAPATTTTYLNVIVDKDQHPLVDRYVDEEPIFKSKGSTPPHLLGRVVVRRGAPFRVEASTPPSPPSQFDLVISLVECKKQTLKCSRVEATYTNVHLATSKTPTFEVTLPNDTPIGNFELQVLAGKVPLVSKNIIVLFNPFTCVDCDEYAGNAANMKDFEEEYVGGDNGLIWQGSAQRHTPTLWTYEPFRAANLLTSLALLEKPRLDPKKRGNPTFVSRHISYAIGERVCAGKWRGSYACAGNTWPNTCSSPSDWSSSSDILEQHWASDTKVKYCQCWVFAGVTTTVGRTFGLAIRPVTTFNSAHDYNNDRSISKFFFIDKAGRYETAEPECPDWCSKNGKVENQQGQNGKVCDLQKCGKEIRVGMGFKDKEECGGCHPCVACEHASDSVWNFHVWNDIFFKRTDIANGNGWQAIDATPQEQSGGRYQMGPASISNVKESTSSCYDTDFVIAEVNADTKLFGYQLGDGPDAKQDALSVFNFKLFDGEPLLHGATFWKDPWGNAFSTIGHTVMTKKVGPISFACAKAPWSSCQHLEHDVTAIYKKCADRARVGGDQLSVSAECGSRADLQKEKSELQCGRVRSGSLLQVEDPTNLSSVSEAQQGNGDPALAGASKGRVARRANEYYRERGHKSAKELFAARRDKALQAAKKKRARNVNSRRDFTSAVKMIPSRPDLMAESQIPNFIVDWKSAPPVGPFGKIQADEELTVTIGFSNIALSSRTIELLFYVIPRYYTGKAVKGIETRTTQHISRLQLRDGGATMVKETIVVGPEADTSFVHTIKQGLTSNSLSALSVDENVYLHFYFSVAVEGKTINYEAKPGLSCPECWERSRATEADGNDVEEVRQDDDDENDMELVLQDDDEAQEDNMEE